VPALGQQAEQFRPERVAIADPARVAELAALVPSGTEVLGGEDALAGLAGEADIVINGVVGFAGLPVTLAALNAGRRLALANKESLIAGGPIVKRAWRTPGAELLPVDSEHCAVHQCLRSVGPIAGKSSGGAPGGLAVRRLVITASGGPFRGRTRHDLEGVTVADALAHPTWKMGPKITIDSSTLMNKGLEVIEAHLLFDIDYDQIDVVVHPQSIVHSMVECTDGATVAQLSLPDMRLPIGYALSYPERMPSPFGAIDWSTVGHLDFEVPDREVFPCLSLAYEAGRRGGTAPACLNGANEIAVQAFLNGELRWVDIPAVINAVMDQFTFSEPRDLADVLAADGEARAMAAAHLQRNTGGRAGTPRAAVANG